MYDIIDSPSGQAWLPAKLTHLEPNTETPGNHRRGELMANPAPMQDLIEADEATIATAATALTRHPRPLQLDCGVQHYDWGDDSYIPGLLGQDNLSRRPFAELWIGAHADLPSRARVDGQAVALDKLIEAAPEAILGRRVKTAFGGKLPFLLKILAARQPLSIQAHPNLAQAHAGFNDESQRGIAIGDARRNYRDASHKPEMIVALSDFYALLGFRPLNEIARTLSTTPELQALGAAWEATNQCLAALYRRLMQMPQPELNAVLDPLLARLEAEHHDAAFERDDQRYWLLQADRLFSRPGRRDRGLLSILLLNLVHLRPGQGLYLPAGELHSYLQGAGLELMANSNNVLRGGLTPKHLDVDELLKVVRVDSPTDPAPSAIIEPTMLDDAWLRYRVPTAEFQLEAYPVPTGTRRRLQSADARLGLVLSGAIELHGNSIALELIQGQAFLIPARCESTLQAAQSAMVYLASVPDDAADPAT
jgi:mannose-6-phosphate isomerase